MISHPINAPKQPFHQSKPQKLNTPNNWKMNKTDQA